VKALRTCLYHVWETAISRPERQQFARELTTLVVSTVTDWTAPTPVLDRMVATVMDSLVAPILWSMGLAGSYPVLAAL